MMGEFGAGCVAWIGFGRRKRMVMCLQASQARIFQESVMNPRSQRVCPDCDSTLDRRHFIKAVGGAALATAAAPVMLGGRIVQAAPTPQSTAETAVGRFYQSL